MPKFGTRSKEQLATCHVDLQVLFNTVIEEIDCSVVCGHRNKEDQEKAFDSGNSKAHYPHGKHNSNPSTAVDVYPYPVDFEDRDRWHYFGCYVLGTARQFGINVIWGGDWDNDTKTKDNSFDDLVHFELK